MSLKVQVATEARSIIFPNGEIWLPISNLSYGQEEINASDRLLIRWEMLFDRWVKQVCDRYGKQ